MHHFHISLWHFTLPFTVHININLFIFGLWWFSARFRFRYLCWIAQPLIWIGSNWHKRKWIPLKWLWNNTASHSPATHQSFRFININGEFIIWIRLTMICIYSLRYSSRGKEIAHNSKFHFGRFALFGSFHVQYAYRVIVISLNGFKFQAYHRLLRSEKTHSVNNFKHSNFKSFTNLCGNFTYCFCFCVLRSCPFDWFDCQFLKGM